MMTRRAGTVAQLAALVLVGLWLLPTLGLVVTAVRDRDQIAATGWWRAPLPVETRGFQRAGGPQRRDGAEFVLSGRVLQPGQSLVAWGISSRAPEAYRPGDTADLGQGARLTVAPDGSYRLSAPQPLPSNPGMRIFVTAKSPPRLTLDNLSRVIGAEGVARALVNTLAVTLPATVLPILIAAFAAHALAWMEFPGRALILAAVAGALVEPLQLGLIPLLRLHNDLGLAKGYVGVWLAHIGFGLPVAIWLLRAAIAALPREIIESARMDGATELQVFGRIVLPLVAPALAGLAVFQFLWVWNDLLVATVFLGNSADQLVLTGLLRELMGSRGGDWDILAAAALVSIVVPVAMFLTMQKYLMRGLLAGAVKGAA